jgi:hypothetical protein
VEIMSAELQEFLKTFDTNGKTKQEVAEANKLLGQFRERFPFRKNPSAIDALAPDDLWEQKTGDRDSFFYWLQYQLKESGHLFIGSKIVFENAIAKIDEFESLLKVTLDDSKTISEKIDAPWENISFFGGDKHIAKKIVHCYYPESVIPIFKTEELKHFCGKLGIGENGIRDESLALFGKDFENLTVGQQWQVLNTLLLGFKSKHKETQAWNNLYFARFLYDSFKTGIPPRATEITAPGGATSVPLNKWGLLFVPRDHEEIMYLFSVLHREIGFPYVVSIGQPYPDVIAINSKGETKRLEIELFASQFDHDPKGCDYVICWENDLEEKPANFPEVIALKDYL